MTDKTARAILHELEGIKAILLAFAVANITHTEGGASNYSQAVQLLRDAAKAAAKEVQ